MSHRRNLICRGNRKAHKIYKKDDPLLGFGWWRGYSKRNVDILESKVGQKFACMQAQNCTYQLLAKMYDIFQHGLIESGNAELLETPVHMNSSGDIVEDIANAYGLPVTMKYICPYNIIVANETRLSTREMGDENSGGQRFMVPIGKTPRHEASSKHSHFTVVPFTRVESLCMMVAIIFSGEKLKAEWVWEKKSLPIGLAKMMKSKRTLAPANTSRWVLLVKLMGKRYPAIAIAAPMAQSQGKYSHAS